MVNTMTFRSFEDKIAHLESLNSIPSINPKAYNENDEYQRLDFIEHPQHGNGFVVEVLGKKEFRAFFSKGLEVLTQRGFLQS
jgi:hypothetical protein